MKLFKYLLLGGGEKKKKKEMKNSTSFTEVAAGAMAIIGASWIFKVFWKHKWEEKMKKKKTWKLVILIFFYKHMYQDFSNGFWVIIQQTYIDRL